MCSGFSSSSTQVFSGESMSQVSRILCQRTWQNNSSNYVICLLCILVINCILGLSLQENLPCACRRYESLYTAAERTPHLLLLHGRETFNFFFQSECCKQQTINPLIFVVSIAPKSFKSWYVLVV